MNYAEWLESRRYRIVRSNRNRAETVDSGLTWEVAKQRAAELDAAECESHPQLTYWTRDMYIPELETAPWNPERK